MKEGLIRKHYDWSFSQYARFYAANNVMGYEVCLSHNNWAIYCFSNCKFILGELKSVIQNTNPWLFESQILLQKEHAILKG